MPTEEQEKRFYQIVIGFAIIAALITIGYVEGHSDGYKTGFNEGLAKGLTDNQLQVFSNGFRSGSDFVRGNFSIVDRSPGGILYICPNSHENEYKYCRLIDYEHSLIYIDNYLRGN